jgi:hypothetical protein
MKPHRTIGGAEPIIRGSVGQPLRTGGVIIDRLFYGMMAIAMAGLLFYGGLGEIFEL